MLNLLVLFCCHYPNGSMHMFGLKQHNDEYLPQVKVLIESMLSGNFLSVDQMTVFTVQSVPDGLIHAKRTLKRRISGE